MNIVFKDAGSPVNKREFVYFDVIILYNRSFISL